MGSDDLTGFWSGHYRYEDGWREPVLFLCNLRDNDGALIGEISEQVSDFVIGEVLRAAVHGQRSGRVVEFAKTYDGAGSFAHRVDYHGEVDAAGFKISGYWHLEGEVGPFVMHRPALAGSDHSVSVEQRRELAEPDQRL